MTTAQVSALRDGLLAALAVWSTLLIPQLISHRARFGRIRPARLALSGAVVAYACLALAVVLLPLPDPEGPRLEQTVQLVPFQWVGDIGTELAKYGRPASEALLTQTFQQACMNVLLFVPFGLLARSLWRRGLLRTTLLGLGISLLIETTQLTANFGTAPFVYRVFDVDDLMNNTAGAALGWIAASLFVALRNATRTVRSAGAARPAPAAASGPAGRPHQVARAVPAVAAHAAVRPAGPPAGQWPPRR
ncbi:VanZ like protein [Prauserella shujinwangii]|uniref:VanZ like protein n=1 Tax=Prauserella shujinwangii TaxID=1453103 RepID=A0A2T0LUQ8_9PSEU|nr:VanZ family protein [Prauserella shujinwangii]PRX47581.1 VanZ like protein [Prauserella shujinwangii]